LTTAIGMPGLSRLSRSSRYWRGMPLAPQSERCAASHSRVNRSVAANQPLDLVPVALENPRQFFQSGRGALACGILGSGSSPVGDKSPGRQYFTPSTRHPISGNEICKRQTRQPVVDEAGHLQHSCASRVCTGDAGDTRPKSEVEHPICCDYEAATLPSGRVKLLSLG
jgi:hypothetical protein